MGKFYKPEFAEIALKRSGFYRRAVYCRGRNCSTACPRILDCNDKNLVMYQLLRPLVGAAALASLLAQGPASRGVLPASRVSPVLQRQTPTTSLR